MLLCLGRQKSNEKRTNMKLYKFIAIELERTALGENYTTAKE